MKKTIQEALTGKVVYAIELSGHEDSLFFTTSLDPDTLKGILLVAASDCCSESWFADIIGVKALLGHQVLSVEIKDMDYYNVCDGRGRQESDIAYGFDIKTSQGVCSVVYRNSSNGYYGGWCEVYDINRPKRDSWAPQLITEDYPC